MGYKTRLQLVLAIVLSLSCYRALSAAEESDAIKQTAQATPETQAPKVAATEEAVLANETIPAEEDLVVEQAEPAQDLSANEPAAPQKQLTLEERMNQRMSLDLRNMDILEALKFVGAKANMNMVYSKGVVGKASLSLEDVPIKDVFDLMLRSNGLAYTMLGDIYNIMSEAEYKTLYGKSFWDIRQVKIVKLKYAMPDQAFNVLDTLKSDVGRIMVDAESGNVLIMDTPDKIEQLVTTLQEYEKRSNIEVFSLKYAKVKEVEETLKSRLDMKKVGSIRIDERNNQLIVQAFPDRMDEIRKLIMYLDRQTKEVLIDAKVIKIALIDKLDNGIQWEGIFAMAKRSGLTYLGSYPFSAVQAVGDVWRSRDTVRKTMGDGVGSYPFSGTATTAGYATSSKASPGENMHYGVVNSEQDYDVLMNILNTLGRTQILATPKIVAVNNQEAKIHVGERQAYVTSTTTTGQSTSTVSEEVTFVNVGVQLSVTPNINDDGYITMKIKPTISSVTSTLVTSTNNRIPIIDTSEAETTVMVKDGTTVIIGGLRREDTYKDYEQLPIVGNLPLFKFFSRSGSERVVRTELAILITPHIISGDTFSTGDERDFGDKPGKDYQEYRPLAKDQKTLASGTTGVIEVKPYRDELTLKERIGDEIPIKGHRYDAK